MIDFKYIGKKKLTLLIALVVAAVVLAAYSELFAKPKLVADEKKLRTTSSEYTRVQNENLNIEDELVFMRERKDEFAVLKEAGFFKKQERDIVQQAVDEAMRLSGIIGGNFRVSPPSCYINKDLKESQYVLLGSPITIDTQSYEDVSLYRFLDYFIRKLPGYVVVERLDIDRTKQMTRSVLQEIGTGERVSLIDTSMTLTWFTIVDKKNIQCSGVRNR